MSLGRTKNVNFIYLMFTDEIEEELAPLIEAQEVKKVETYDEQVNRAKQGAQDLGWVHFLGNEIMLSILYCRTLVVITMIFDVIQSYCCVMII